MKAVTPLCDGRHIVILAFRLPRQQNGATGPYGLPILESCLTCVLKEEGLFCQLSPEALGELSGIRQTAFYPEGAVLFSEGGSPRGLFILRAGRAKLSATSKDGRSVTLRVVLPGEVMGLSCVMAYTNHQATAQTVAPSEICMVPRIEFLRFLRNHPEAAIRVAEHLSMELHKAWAQTRLLALAPNARAKLAQVLLLWAELQGQATIEGVRLPLNMTQESVGEAIGATRETVSRLLSEFRHRRLIQVHGGTVLLLDVAALREIGTA